MPGAIPLIRGFALLPTLHWLAQEGASIELALAETGLSSSPITDPFRPIPLVHAAALLRNAAREHGPDVPCRVLSRSGSLEIAMLGKVALGARTPAEALGRVVFRAAGRCAAERNVEAAKGTKTHDSRHRVRSGLFRSGLLHPRIPPVDWNPTQSVPSQDDVGPQLIIFAS